MLKNLQRRNVTAQQFKTTFSIFCCTFWQIVCVNVCNKPLFDANEHKWERKRKKNSPMMKKTYAKRNKMKCKYLRLCYDDCSVQFRFLYYCVGRRISIRCWYTNKCANMKFISRIKLLGIKSTEMATWHLSICFVFQLFILIHVQLKNYYHELRNLISIRFWLVF